MRYAIAARYNNNPENPNIPENMTATNLNLLCSSNLIKLLAIK